MINIKTLSLVGILISISINPRDKNMSSRPNFLIFVVDEKRYPTSYETQELKDWRENNLLFEKELAKTGITFTNHYTNSMACAPIRTTFHTGHLPTVHGVLNTDGIALRATDEEMKWLEPFTVPTIGNWFKNAGWNTYLKGKWHVTDASIKLGNGEDMRTYDDEGKRLLLRERLYMEQDPLKDYGYHNWIGPEPHGPDPLNSASATSPPTGGRDLSFKEQVLEELERLEDLSLSKPWLLMANFVNPHDIALYGALSSASGQFNFPVDETLPDKLFTDEFDKSLKEDLSTKPKAQTQYRNRYSKIVQPVLDIDRYQRAYFTMQKDVDKHLMEVWNKFKTSRHYDNTYILFFSDHGDLLASHGGMHQKWFNAYQESIKVPFIVSSPLLNNKDKKVNNLTSHIDILPTLLGLAGLNQSRIRKNLAKSFSLALPLPGKDLSSYITGEKSCFVNTPIYFMTEDNPTKGPHQYNNLGKSYKAIGGACCVEAIVHKLESTLWKITRYYSNNPKWRPSKDEILYELYNLTDDPMELNNLYNSEDEQVQEVRKEMEKNLRESALFYRF